MNDHVQRAYRHLLYQAMLDIRTLSWPPRGLQWINPAFLARYIRHVRALGELAEWLHNMAESSRRNFDGFDEERFWREFSRLKEHHPAFASYRAVFENALAEARTGKWPSIEEQQKRNTVAL